MCWCNIGLQSDRGLRWYTGTIWVSSLGIQQDKELRRDPSSPVSPVTCVCLQTCKQISTQSWKKSWKLTHQLRQAASKSLIPFCPSICPCHINLLCIWIMQILCLSLYSLRHNSAMSCRDLFHQEKSHFNYSFTYILTREIATQVSQFVLATSLLICLVVTSHSLDSIHLNSQQGLYSVIHAAWHQINASLKFMIICYLCVVFH